MTRALLGDPDALMYPDTFLLAPINSAATEVGNELRAYGFDSSKKPGYVFTNVPANTKVIGVVGTTPLLPTDFMEPIQLWEKPTGSDVTNYTPVTLAREEIPPTFIPGPLLGQYTFLGGALNFLGATQALDILMDYVKAPGVFAAPGDAPQVPDTSTAIANRAAAIVANTDQPESMGGFQSTFQAELERIVQIYMHHRQRKARRPRPYRGARARFR